MDSFRDRRDAGVRLARVLAEEVDLGSSPVVLGIPRGGVVVADAVARELGAELDVIAVEKVGAPWNPELALGAVGEGDLLWMDDRLAVSIDEAALQRAVAAERRELAEKLADVRRIWPRIELRGRCAIVVDDGIATGSTVRVALAALQRAAPARRILAVPVGPPETVAELEPVTDRVVCPLRPPYFQAVGLWYERFDQVDRAQVLEVFHRRLEQVSPR